MAWTRAVVTSGIRRTLYLWEVLEHVRRVGGSATWNKGERGPRIGPRALAGPRAARWNCSELGNWQGGGKGPGVLLGCVESEMPAAQFSGDGKKAGG